MVIWRRGRSLVLRIGRRGASLLFLGLLDVVVALSLIPAVSPEVKTSELHQSINDVAPLWAWAVCWIVVAVACLVYAFRTQDRIAYTMAAAIKAMWASVYITAWLVDGVPRAWVGAAIWTAFGAWVLVISTWPEVFSVDGISPNQRDAVIVADQNGMVLSWNDTATKLFGWTREEILGQDVHRIMPDRFRPDHDAALQQVKDTGHSELVGRAVPRRGLHKSGREFDVEVVISVLATQMGYTFTAVIRPIKGGPA